MPHKNLQNTDFHGVHVRCGLPYLGFSPTRQEKSFSCPENCVTPYVVSRFSSVLETILTDRGISRSAFARLCAVSPSTIGDYLSGEIEITKKNLALILRGILDANDRGRLLIAHLEDQIPEEMRDAVEIAPAKHHLLEETNETGATTNDVILRAFADVPGDLRDEVVWLVNRLRDDPALRELLRRTTSYLGDEHKRVYRQANRRLGAGDPSASVRAAVTAAKRASSSSRSTAS